MTEQPGAELPKYGERRLRPQYGEYATPQEQAKIIADSLPAVSPLLVPPADGHSTAAGAPQPPDASTRVPGAAPAAGRRPRRWVIILTAVLLGYATINVIAQLLTKDTLATIVTQFFITQNIGQYVPTELTANLGETLNVITLGLFVFTVLVTTWMLRRGRVAFWVPIAGGVAATVVALVFVVILLQSDPVFIAYMNRAGK